MDGLRYSQPMALNNSRVDIHANYVEKHTSSPASMARKYAAVHEIAMSSDFRAPDVLQVGPSSIILERVEGMIALDSLYTSADHKLLNDKIYRAGEVLAILHSNLPTSETVAWQPSPVIQRALDRYSSRHIDATALPHATLHGDFSFANVSLTGTPAQITIIDPCANFGSTFDDWTLGPIYVDIGKMLACLEGQIPFRRQHLRPSQARIEQLQQAFIGGYGRCGVKLDIEVAHAFAFAVSSAQFYRRMGKFSAFHRFALYNRFRGNYPAARKRRRSGGRPS